MSTVQSAWKVAVQTGFRLLYREMSWSYDAVSHAVSLGRWQTWRQACLPFLVGPRVLELGCGPGHLQVELTEQGLLPVGLDPSPQMTRTAVHRLRQTGYPSQITRALGQALPFANGRFNSVVATFPTLYISDYDTLSEIRRVLVPDGRLVIVLEAQLTDGVALRRLIDAAYRLTGQRPAGQREEVQHWSDVLRERMTAAGLAAEIHAVTLTDSIVTLVVAQRLGSW